MKKEVAIMTMGFNPWLKMHSVCNALDQTYKPVVLHLLHQSPFPPPIQHDGYIKIIEHYVAGAWPAIWYFKLVTFLNACTSPYFAIMDEDDRFEHTYLRKAFIPIENGAPLAWNHTNIIIKNIVEGTRKTPLFKLMKYNSGMGTLVGRTDALRTATQKLGRKCPRGLTEGGGGPIDAVLKRIINKMGVVEHKGSRKYFYHMNTNTKGNRDKRESIDYGWNERIVEGNFKSPKLKKRRKKR